LCVRCKPVIDCVMVSIVSVLQVVYLSTDTAVVIARAVESLHKTSDSDSSIFKTPTPTPS
jgi:hypothetical protein